MLYRVNYSEGVLEFVKNRCRAFLEAPDPACALRATRDLFDHVREENIQHLGGNQYLVSFKVALDYRMSLLRSAEKAIKLLRSKDNYNEGRFIDRYIVATMFLETGKPDFLAGLNIIEEIGTLRKAAVVAREVHNVMTFVDWDICIYNYLELNTKEGFQSRVIRKVST
jgi:hypothetical protein